MSSKRKMWGTRFTRSEVTRHDSKADAYRFVAAQADRWRIGFLRSQYLTVYVDERDGRGWRTYEQIDLAEL